MDDRRRSRALLAVLTLIALVLITLDYRQGDDGALSAVRRGALIVFAPVQDGFSQVTGSIGGFFGDVRDYASLRGANAELEAEVRELRDRIPAVTDLERENTELRALLGMRERFELETTAARVIGQSPGERGNTVMIDAGAEAGIETGMAVVSTHGLVGKVVQTTPWHARVELLSSPTARYAVRIAQTAESGLLRGAGADPFRLELLDPEAQARVGSEVVTRTFEGSTIPDGLPVGEVVDREEVEATEGRVSPRFHLVRPYVDFRRLSIVQVVLNAPEPPVDLDPDDVIEPPRGPRPDPPAGQDPQDDDDPDDDPDDADGDGDGGDGDEEDEGAEGDA
jgi:rod shape-determining protein MreC